ncbi:unnamed protein product [Caenorhabditis sp. 36 PRJEB53466]|nr:unnamed protein product [Caenorhabditis sp. 36 PRJEB53466]
MTFGTVTKPFAKEKNDPAVGVDPRPDETSKMMDEDGIVRNGYEKIFGAILDSQPCPRLTVADLAEAYWSSLEHRPTRHQEVVLGLKRTEPSSLAGLAATSYINKVVEREDVRNKIAEILRRGEVTLEKCRFVYDNALLVQYAIMSSLMLIPDQKVVFTYKAGLFSVFANGIYYVHEVVRDDQYVDNRYIVEMARVVLYAPKLTLAVIFKVTAPPFWTSPPNSSCSLEFLKFLLFELPKGLPNFSDVEMAAVTGASDAIQQGQFPNVYQKMFKIFLKDDVDPSTLAIFGKAYLNEVQDLETIDPTSLQFLSVQTFMKDKLKHDPEVREKLAMLFRECPIDKNDIPFVYFHPELLKAAFSKAVINTNGVFVEYLRKSFLATIDDNCYYNEIVDERRTKERNFMSIMKSFAKSAFDAKVPVIFFTMEKQEGDSKRPYKTIKTMLKELPRRKPPRFFDSRFFLCSGNPYGYHFYVLTDVDQFCAVGFSLEKDAVYEYIHQHHQHNHHLHLLYHLYLH